MTIYIYIVEILKHTKIQCDKWTMCGLYNAKQMWKIRHNFLMSLTAQPNESWCPLRCIRMMACINHKSQDQARFFYPQDARVLLPHTWQNASDPCSRAQDAR
jgi:hypothetical protein